MRVKFRKSSLEKALAIVAGCVQNNSNKEQLKCVLVKADLGSVTIEATNLDIFAKTTVKDADIDYPGRVLIEAAKLRKIVADAGDEISIETDSDNILTIKSGKFKTRNPTMPVDEFPTMPTLEEPTRYSITSKDLISSIPKVVKAIDEDSTRYALGGVGLDCDGDTLNFVGTDGRRLAHVACKVANIVNGKSNASTTPVVPADCLRVLLKAATDEVVEVELGFNSIIFTCGGNVVNSRLVDGRFPNWRQVIPQIGRTSQSGETELIATVPANDLVVALRQVSITADSETRGATFLFSKDKLTVKASAVDSGESESELSVEFDGAISIKLDIDYVKELATSVGSESFKLYLLNGQSSVVARHDNFTYVLMPMALG